MIYCPYIVKIELEHGIEIKYNGKNDRGISISAVSDAGCPLMPHVPPRCRLVKYVRTTCSTSSARSRSSGLTPCSSARPLTSGPSPRRFRVGPTMSMRSASVDGSLSSAPSVDLRPPRRPRRARNCWAADTSAARPDASVARHTVNEDGGDGVMDGGDLGVLVLWVESDEDDGGGSLDPSRQSWRSRSSWSSSS